MSGGRAGSAAARCGCRARPRVPLSWGISLVQAARLGRQRHIPTGNTRAGRALHQLQPRWQRLAMPDTSCRGWAGRDRALGTAGLAPMHKDLLFRMCPRHRPAHGRQDVLGWRAALQSPACHIPELFGCFYFLTCSDSSSFMSSFGGNKSLAWMYSKLGGPSSPCIANRAHSQTASASTCCESQKLKLMDTLGTPGAWAYLCMEMPVLPADPSSSSGCCRMPTAQ